MFIIHAKIKIQKDKQANFVLNVKSHWDRKNEKIVRISCQKYVFPIEKEWGSGAQEAEKPCSILSFFFAFPLPLPFPFPLSLPDPVLSLSFLWGVCGWCCLIVLVQFWDEADLAFWCGGWRHPGEECCLSFSLQRDLCAGTGRHPKSPGTSWMLQGFQHTIW